MVGRKRDRLASPSLASSRAAGDNTEVLGPGMDRSASVLLGRNRTTAITDAEVSRKLCSVTLCTDGSVSLMMRKPRQNHRVTLDGRALPSEIGEVLPLRHGQVLALLGRRYAYKVKLDPTPPSVATASLNPLLVATVIPECESDEGGGAKALRKRKSEKITRKEHVATLDSARDHIVDELTCTICMEILAKAEMLNPCGHAVCGECAADLFRSGTSVDGKVDGKSNCPTCREKVLTTTRARCLDNLVWSMVLMGRTFDRDDLRHYLGRCGRSPSEAEVSLSHIIMCLPLQCLIPPPPSSVLWCTTSFLVHHVRILNSLWIVINSSDTVSFFSVDSSIGSSYCSTPLVCTACVPPEQVYLSRLWDSPDR